MSAQDPNLLGLGIDPTSVPALPKKSRESKAARRKRTDNEFWCRMVAETVGVITPGMLKRMDAELRPDFERPLHWMLALQSGNHSIPLSEHNEEWVLASATRAFVGLRVHPESVIWRVYPGEASLTRRVSRLAFEKEWEWGKAGGRSFPVTIAWAGLKSVFEPLVGAWKADLDIDEYLRSEEGRPA